MNYTSHTPEELLDNPHLARFIKVFDGLCEYKDIEIHNGTQKSFNPVLCDNPNFWKKYLYELGDFPTSAYFTRRHYERLILNAIDLFRMKGTRPGFDLLVDVLCDGVITVFTVRYNPALRLEPSEVLYIGDTVNPDSPCFLPDEDMLLLTTTSPLDYPYLFGSDDFDYFEPFAGITIKTALSGNSVFEEYMTGLLPKFLPVTKIENFTITFIP